MNDFIHHNPVRIIFGRDRTGEMGALLPPGSRVLFAWGGGSIRKNGIHEKVSKALAGFEVFEFGGIRPNPSFEHLVGALPLIRREKIDFLLAVGGGSVIDGVKFLALAARYEGPDPWRIMDPGTRLEKALPLGAVLTIPGTGSEANPAFVISRDGTAEKLGRVTPLAFPAFSVIDPSFTFSLPERQLANGIADSFVHVCEQYLTGERGAPLQARQAEAILVTLAGEKDRVMAMPPSYEARANFAWCATQALDGLIARGVRQDWATHAISHELTALHGLDHARALAVVLPALLRHQADHKKARLLQYGERVWGIDRGSEDERISRAIGATADFFESLSIPTGLGSQGIDPREAGSVIAGRIGERQGRIGEEKRIGPAEIRAIFGIIP